MAEHYEDYVISTAFTGSGSPGNRVVDADKLKQEILDDPAIPNEEGVIFLGIIVEPHPNDDRCRAVFNLPINGAAKAALDVRVAAHDGLPFAPLKLHDFIATNGTDHRQINYRTGLVGRLHRYVDFDDPSSWFRGEFRLVEFYDDTAKTNKVLDVKVEYKRQPNGLLTRVNDNAVWGDADYFGRRVTRTWYRSDGNPHPLTKVTYKTYDLDAAAAEGERRRESVKRRLKLAVLSMIVATTAVDPAAPTQAEIDAAEVTGAAYLAKYRDQINDYIETGDLSFKTLPAGVDNNITEDTEAFLNSNVVAFGWTGPTIRDEILNALQGIMA